MSGKREENVDYVLSSGNKRAGLRRGKYGSECTCGVGDRLKREWGLCSVSCRKLVRSEGQNSRRRGGKVKY